MKINLSIRQLEKACNYVTVYKFLDNITKQTEWLRKLLNIDFQITKASRVCYCMYETFQMNSNIWCNSITSVLVTIS